MDLSLIDGLVDLLKRSPALSEIEYSDGTHKVRLATATGQVSPSATATPSSPAPAVTLPQEPAVVATARHTVHAGLVGTFYRASAPDQPPFASPGDIVEAGQTVAIVEAMKMLNPVEADRAGRITAFLVDNAAAVTPETALLVIEPVEAGHV